MSFEYRQKVFYRDNSGLIQSALFSEYWCYESAYITNRGNESMVYVSELFVSKKELLLQDISDIKNQIKTVDNLENDKPLIQEKLKKLEKEFERVEK